MKKFFWLRARGFWLLAIPYLLLSINYSLANAATPTPKAGDVGVKAEVKGPSPSLSGTTTPTPSTVSASPTVKKQTEDPAKKSGEAQAGVPKAEIQEQTRVSGSFVEEAIKQADNLLVKDNLWLKLLALFWVIFIAAIAFLVIRYGKKKKLEPQSAQTQGQTFGETSPTGSETTGSETTTPESRVSS